MGNDPVGVAYELVRDVCLSLPEVNQRLSHGAESWFIRDKRQIAAFRANDYSGGRPVIWCPAPPGVQQDLVELEPERFFRPPYVGPSGWIGVYLDIDLDPAEVRAIIVDAYRHVGPKTLTRQLDVEHGP